MPSTKCDIYFENNPHGIYYAGQNVSGSVELTTSRPKTIRSIHITINGFADVRWVENIYKANTQGKREKLPETFSSTEEYIAKQIHVIPHSAEGSIELPSGKYTFPFSAQIPSTTPSSFNGTLGQVRYEVVLTIDRPIRYDNIFKQPFTVISSYDLNTNHSLECNVEQVEEKQFCCNLLPFCERNNHMVLKVNLPLSGAAPGQKTKFNVFLDNQSNVDCSEIKVRLMKCVTYTCKTPDIKTRTVETKIADTKLGSVDKNNSVKVDEFIIIPSTPPTTDGQSQVIQISYNLHFVAKVSGLHRDFNVNFPFIIGTVPLFSSLMRGNEVVSLQPGSKESYNSLPIPTYEEDVNRKEVYKDNDEFNKYSKLKEFIPMYPVYRDGEPGRSDSGYPNHPRMWEIVANPKHHAPPVPSGNIGFSLPPLGKDGDKGPKIGWRSSIHEK